MSTKAGTFSITPPSSKPSEQKSDASALLKILVIDDSPEDRIVARFALEDFGCLVKEAESGRNGLMAAEAFKPDCILLDYRLPDMDGIEVLDALRAPGGEIPLAVVVLTAVSDAATATKFLQAGAQDYLNKSHLTDDSFSLRRAIQVSIERFDLLRRQRELQERNAQLAAVVTASSDAILRVGLDLTVQSWNPGATAIFGYCESEAMGRSLNDLIAPPELRDDQPEHYRQVIVEQKAIFVETTRRRKDGGRLFVELSAAPIQDLDGKTIAISVTFRDVSERKRAEEILRQQDDKLRASQLRLRIAADAARMTYADYDFSSGRLELAENYAQVMCHSSSAQRADSPVEFIDDLVLNAAPADRARVRQAHQDFLAGKPKGSLTYRVLCDDGAERWIESAWTLQSDASGKPLRSMITCRDVTAVEGGRALETARNKSEEILATIADGFCALDKNWRFDFINVHAEVMLGKKAADVLGHSYFQVFPHAEDTQLHANFARVMAEKHPLDFELMCPILKRPTSFSVHPTREGGIWVGFRDVSEQRAVEAALIAAKAEAERANAAKSTFLAAASHDLRQPVQSLVLLLAIAEREAQAQPKTKKIIALMKRSLDGLNALLGAVLDLSRLDAGVESPIFETVDLGAKLLRLHDEYAPRAAAKGLELRLAPRRIFVRSDARLLARAIRNLIENALRYTSTGGVLVGVRRRGAYVRIDVYDTGVGIPAGQQANIFEEFHQLHNPGRDLEKGLGLGLAIVARLASLLGAEIEVSSRPGRGSRFSLVLPEVAGVSSPIRSESETAIRDPGGRVLIVEDNAVVRHSLTAMLDNWGYDATAVASGEEALELAATGDLPFDILITDQRLGAGLTGTDTAREINRRASRALPALVLTGDTAKERIAEINSSGYSMLHKPVSATELRREIAALIRRELH